MANENFTLWVITEDIPVETDVTGGRNSDDIGGGWGRKAEDSGKKRVPLDALALKAQMEGLIHVVGDLFTTAEAKSGMQLNEVQLSVAISADGKVNILGMGGGLANNGGITLKFARQSDSEKGLLHQ
ncbi:MAG: hypothetical protein WCA35_27310 [Kovacikia sp.]